jgi:hypothetical protein
LYNSVLARANQAFDFSRTDENEMLRLTRTSPGTSEVVLKAEGQIVGEWVALLESECRELLAT